MKKIIIAFLYFVIIVLISNCKKNNTIEPNPNFSFAHGVLIGPDGVFEPNANYILDIQNQFITKYEDSLALEAKGRLGNIKKNIYSKVTDKVLARAIYLDWIVDNMSSKNPSTLSIANNSLRWYYVKNIQNDPILPSGNENWSKGIERKIALELEQLGMNVMWEVRNGSPKYIDDCLSAGVPVPDELLSDNWEPLGTLSQQILALGSSRELHMFLSDDPPGFCISMISYLPEDDERPENEEHLDLICFGTQTDNACFFENVSIEITAGVPIDILDLNAKNELPGALNYCISCHPGENPFIVHPNDSVYFNAYALKGSFFETAPNLNGTGTKMYKVVDAPDWPKNPPPFDDLNSIDSEEKCTQCHTSLNAGRFPDFNQADASDFSYYCNNILNAVLGNQVNFDATMPLGDVDNEDKYFEQIDALRASCSNDDEGKIVDNKFDDDISVKSPPRIVDPLVQCAEKIYVENVEDEATITLFINGTVVEIKEQVEETPPLLEFTNFDEFIVGDKVHVTQSKTGMSTTSSTAVIVKDYKTIHPNGLPQPIIEPNIIYECADVISVLYDIPGLPLDVMVNGGTPFRAHTFAGYEVVYPNNSPFNIDDKFTARVLACDEESPLSIIVEAQEAPDNIEFAIINPESLYPGQTLINIGNLTYGTHSTLVNQNSEIVTSFSWPLSWKNARISNPISLTDGAFVAQEICDVNSGEPLRLTQVKPCDEVPVANIRDPRPGDDYIMVIGLIPGSRTHIYDSEGNELGDSNLGVVQLNRHLEAGEIITAFLQIGECISPLAIQFPV